MTASDQRNRPPQDEIELESEMFRLLENKVTPAPTIDYLAVEYLGYLPAHMAMRRDVTRQTICDNIDRAKQVLGELEEEVGEVAESESYEEEEPPATEADTEEDEDP